MKNKKNYFISSNKQSIHFNFLKAQSNIGVLFPWTNVRYFWKESKIYKIIM